MTSNAKKERKTYTPQFKEQIVQLFNSGKRKADLIREYDLTPSALDRWIRQANTTGSFKEKDNRSDEENEMIQMKKRIKQLEMENDILKQAALIMGRR